MTTPMQAMAEWFASQPEEVQKQAGFMIYSGIAEVINDDEYEFGSEPSKAFLSWLEQPIDGNLGALAKTLLAREHIRFTMIDDLCTQKR